MIRTRSDLQRAWRSLMQPLGWSRTSTWVMFIGPDDRPLPRLTEIDDCDGPSPEGGAVPLEAVHLATHEQVAAVPLDDAGLPRTA